MGRELRRVALDFDWPLNKVYSGFLNPHYKECPETDKNCFNGYTAAGKWLDAIARLIATVGEEAVESTPEHLAHFKKRGRIYPHPYLQEWPQAPHKGIPRQVMERIRAIEDKHEKNQALHDYYSRNNHPQLIPLTEELAVLVKALADGCELAGFGSSSAVYQIWRTLIKTAGLDEEKWGICKVCGGDCLDPDVREVYESWQREPPPTGEGYQLWETVSEGSPVSPVFPTKEAFIDYLVEAGYSEKAAKNFTESGWCPSGVVVTGGENAGTYDGIESCGLLKT